MSKSVIRRNHLGRVTYFVGGHAWTTDLKKAKRYPNSTDALRELGQRTGSVVSEHTANLDHPAKQMRPAEPIEPFRHYPKGRFA